MRTLRLQDLVIGRGGRRVAGPLSAEFPGGCLHVLLGPNGSGKSTLARTVLGLLPPLAGRVVLEPPGPAAFVPQAGATPPALPGTVGEWLDLDLGGPRARRRARLAEVLEEVGLRGFAHRPWYRLSGGERQRVLVARAMLAEASLFVLDEPTASVDREGCRALWELVFGIACDPDRVTLAITHDRFDAMRLAGRVWILDEGRLAPQEHARA